MRLPGGRRCLHYLEGHLPILIWRLFLQFSVFWFIISWYTAGIAKMSHCNGGAAIPAANLFF